MKRIAENVALDTILYIVGGNQKIRIIDYPNTYDCSKKKHGILIFENEYKNRNYNSFTYWEEHAKVHYIEPKNDTLEIGICTNADDYKIPKR